MNVSKEYQQKGLNLVQDLVKKSWESEAFKQELIKNPKATIESLTGESFGTGENFKIVVEDQTDPSKIYINIPRKFDEDDFELTDEQLENVSGGDITLGGVMLTIAVCSAVYSAGLGIYDAVTDGK